MRNSPTRLVVTDFDGTLLDNDKQISSRALEAVHGLAQRNIDFTACSGRPGNGMQAIITALGVSLPFGALNGGVIFNPDMTIVRALKIGPRRAAKALRFLAQRGVSAWLFTATDWYILDANGLYVEHEVAAVKIQPTVVPSFKPYLAEAIKIVAVSADRHLTARLEVELQEHLGNGVSAARSNLWYLDVTHARANKGSFVRWLSRQRKVRKAQVCTLGDMPADVLMFKHSGLGIAMGNAPDSVKQAADCVAGDNTADGWARAIEEHVLNDE